MMWKKIKVILVITFVSLEIFSLSFSSFAAQNSQSLDNVNADIPDNRTGLDANGATIRNDNTVSYFLCLLILILTGTIARVILSLAIFVIGILFFLGKINWTALVSIAIGAGITYGAVMIVVAILPRATQVVDQTSGSQVIITKTTSQIIGESCPEIA